VSLVSQSAFVLVTAAALVLACGGAPAPAESSAAQAPPPAKRRADVADDCAEVAGQPPPEPLAKVYEGVAAKARCQREVYTIMGGLTHFLGVPCEHCHVKDDYAKPTHNKAVANWMARELIPSLEKKAGGEVWCNDCHVVDGKGTAKILGNPRKQSWAIEWMTAHLTDDFQRSADHGTLRCKDCHGANLGSADFKRKIILTDHLPPRPTPPAAPQPEPDTSAADAGAPEAVDAGSL
jgi:hypothetical protein